jgi:hypothetical protein
MPKEAVFTMKLEPEFWDQFMAAAQAAYRPASQVVRDVTQDFIQRQREHRDYREFFRRKVQTARSQRDAGWHSPMRT